jgi:hypothetical protein
MQAHVVGFLTFHELAQQACVSKQLHTLYMDRVMERDRVVAARLESDFTAEVRDRLSPAQTALPRDLVVDPQVRGPELLVPAGFFGRTRCDSLLPGYSPLVM